MRLQINHISDRARRTVQQLSRGKAFSTSMAVQKSAFQRCREDDADFESGH